MITKSKGAKYAINEELIPYSFNLYSTKFKNDSYPSKLQVYNIMYGEYITYDSYSHNRKEVYSYCRTF